MKAFFRWFTKERTSQLTYICSDMWKPYISIIRGWAGDAVHILDRFHIMSHFGKAIDKVRAEEHRELKEQGKETLKHSRWCLLKRQEYLTETQATKLSDLLRYNLRSVRAYLLKEDFQQLWTYSSLGWAKRSMDQRCRRAMKSRIDPIKDVAKMIRKHQELGYDTQLVSCQRDNLSSRCGGLKQQMQSDYKKIIRISDLRSSKNHALSHDWGAT